MAQQFDLYPIIIYITVMFKYLNQNQSPVRLGAIQTEGKFPTLKTLQLNLRCDECGLKDRV